MKSLAEVETVQPDLWVRCSWVAAHLEHLSLYCLFWEFALKKVMKKLALKKAGGSLVSHTATNQNFNLLSRSYIFWGSKITPTKSGGLIQRSASTSLQPHCLAWPWVRLTDVHWGWVFMGRASESPIAHLFVGPWKAWAEPCLQISPLICVDWLSSGWGNHAWFITALFSKAYF